MVIETNVIQLSKDLIKVLKNNGIHIEEAYLFGSRVKGSFNQFSDVDLALISKNFSGYRFKDNEMIIDKTPNSFYLFDTHPYRPEDFNKNDPFVREILKDAFRVV